MGGISLEQLPPEAHIAWTRLCDALRATAGDVVAIWAYVGRSPLHQIS